MSSTTTHDPDAGYEPAYAAPALLATRISTCSGRQMTKYPYGTDIRYKPPYEPLEAYLKLAHRLSFVRYVFVQPSAYGFDNSCMLDAMCKLDPAVRRGVIDLDETKTNDKELAELNALGVRGIRVNVSPVRKPEAGLADFMKPRIAYLAKLCKEIGWHLDFLTPGWLVSELIPVFRELPLEFSVAHMGLFPAKDGPAQRDFQEFLKLVGDGSKRCWVKLTGIYRFSTAPGFADVKPVAQALMQTVPDQLIWGSDFPHCLSMTKSAPSSSTTCWASGRQIRRCASASSPITRRGCLGSNKLTASV